VHLISSLVKISETDNQQQKPTENPRLSPLFSAHECACFLIQHEDMMEMLNVGLLEAIVVDDWKAKMWVQLLPNLRV
jgi:Predicted soluble lytic transglycosylase fused to an ABC-type amino acid-binding protein